MRWASALSELATLPDALADVVGTLQAELDGVAPDLLLVFSSVHHGLHWDVLARVLRSTFPGAQLVGCSGSGIVGGGREIEGSPALSLTAACLPDVEVRPFRIAEGDDPDHTRAQIGSAPAHGQTLLVFGHPVQMAASDLTAHLHAALPHAQVLGGLASGGQDDGHMALFLGHERVHDAAVGVALWGDVDVEVVVGPGGRAVGSEHRVTAATGALVRELDGRAALEVLEETFESLEGTTRMQFQHGPVVGVCAAEDDGDRDGGGYLLRPIAGVDPPRGAFVVPEGVQQGDLMRFHVRDAGAAAEALRRLVRRSVAHHGPVAAVLQVCCLGRGRRFHGADDVDVRAVTDEAGDPPVAGFFAHGELATWHGRAHAHTFTCAVALFRRPTWN